MACTPPGATSAVSPRMTRGACGGFFMTHSTRQGGGARHDARERRHRVKTPSDAETSVGRVRPAPLGATGGRCRLSLSVAQHPLMAMKLQ